MTRCVVRLLGREATADMALRLLVDVELQFVCEVLLGLIASEQRAKAKRNDCRQRSRRPMSRLLEGEHPRDRARNPFPVRGVFVEMLLPGARQSVELRAAIVLVRAPFALDPALVFELVESGVERAVLTCRMSPEYVPRGRSGTT
jgi:hypothetical protein